MTDDRIPGERVRRVVDPATGVEKVHIRVSTAESRAAGMKVRRMRARGETPSAALISVATAGAEEPTSSDDTHGPPHSTRTWDERSSVSEAATG